MEKKKVWLSKTFWINILALITMVAQTQTSFVISPEMQIAILGVVNIVLRIVTKEEVSWK